MKSSTYFAALVRAHLSRDLPLTGEELAAFKQSVVILTGLGEVLDRMTRKDSQASTVAGDRQLDLMHLRLAVAALEQRLHDLVRAALISWESGYG